MQAVDWKLIIEKHGPAVWQTAYRLLGNHADTSDCFQETFICALNVCKNQQVKNFPALLTRLATTRAIDQLRRRFRQQSQISVRDYNHEASSDDSDPAKYVQKQELSSWLLKELAQLPLQEAQVFCLRHLNDMTYRQIAKELDIKTNAVGVILHRAKEKLRKSLDVSNNMHKSEVTL